MMRRFAPRAAALSATLLVVLGASLGTARGDRWVETVYATSAPVYLTTSDSYVVPTRYSYVPTGYSYVPTSYSYVLPASYATTAYSWTPTSYVAPAYYETTYFRRPGLLRRLASRPVIETTRSYASDVVPTTYYQPTTISYVAPTVATSLAYATPCVETTVPFAPPPPVQSGGAADPTAKSLTNRAQAEGDPEPPLNDGASKKAAPANPATPKDDPPVTPPDDRDLGGGGLEPPTTPPATPPGDGSRTSFRPVYTDLRPKVGATSSNVLRGLVVTGLNDAPKANVEVIFSDLRGTYPDRKKLTDSKGAFEVFLPNGGWSVRVVDPANPADKARDYNAVTATAGRYLDDADAPIQALRLSY